MSSSSDSGRVSNWVNSLLMSSYGEFLCEVDEEYIRDKFNLTYLEREVQNFRKAYEIIVGISFDEDYNDEAIKLYGLIHARYIMTPMGLSKMYAKYKEGAFGYCPRVLCTNAFILPIGISDRPEHHSVKLYCPSCRDVYSSKGRKGLIIDGAWFGTSFPHLLLQTYSPDSSKKAVAQYVPKIFGFRLVN